MCAWSYYTMHYTHPSFSTTARGLKGQHSAPRGGPPRSWTNDELTKALQNVWNKRMTTSQASRVYGIPYNSLLMYVRGKYGKSLKLDVLKQQTPAANDNLNTIGNSRSTPKEKLAEQRQKQQQHQHQHPQQQQQERRSPSSSSERSATSTSHPPRRSPSGPGPNVDQMAMYAAMLHQHQQNQQQQQQSPGGPFSPFHNLPPALQEQMRAQLMGILPPPHDGSRIRELMNNMQSGHAGRQLVAAMAAATAANASNNEEVRAAASTAEKQAAAAAASPSSVVAGGPGGLLLMPHPGGAPSAFSMSGGSRSPGSEQSGSRPGSTSLRHHEDEMEEEEENIDVDHDANLDEEEEMMDSEAARENEGEVDAEARPEAENAAADGEGDNGNEDGAAGDIASNRPSPIDVSVPHQAAGEISAL